MACPRYCDIRAGSKGGLAKRRITRTAMFSMYRSLAGMRLDFTQQRKFSCVRFASRLAACGLNLRSVELTFLRVSFFNPGGRHTRVFWGGGVHQLVRSNDATLEVYLFCF